MQVQDFGDGFTELDDTFIVTTANQARYGNVSENDILQGNYETYNESFVWITNKNMSNLTLTQCLNNSIIDYDDYCITRTTYNIEATDDIGVDLLCSSQDVSSSEMPLMRHAWNLG